LNSNDPYDNPYGDFDPDLTRAHAHEAAIVAQERALEVRSWIALHAQGDTSNIIARSARKSANFSAEKLDRTASLALASFEAGEAATAPEEKAVAYDAAIEHYIAANKIYSEVAENAYLEAAAARPDPAELPIVEPPLPTTQDWKSVSSQVNVETMRWAASVRGQTGKMLILRPSPGTGKTHSMCDLAINEQRLRQRVVFAARTKDVLCEELEPRVRKSGPFVRLHVIQGRDATSCWNFANVEAVQQHGYAPGRTVCFSCDHHPRVAFSVGANICPYYQTRIRAQNDTNSARRGMHEYPIILTTHSGFLAAVDSGGGMYGQFWPCDTLLIDEDPTESFEPEVIVNQRHAAFTSANPVDRPAVVMAAMLRSAIDLASIERKAMRDTAWKSTDGVQSPIHNRLGSVYAGQALHDLLSRVATGAFGQQYNVRSAIQVLRDVSDSHAQPAVGALFGATTAAAVSLVVPPQGLARTGEALFEEISMRANLRRYVYQQVHGRELPIATAPEVEKELSERVETLDTAYRVRLEFARDEWRFVVQGFTDMRDQTANVVVGDAYAHVEHYRQVFDKPATTSDPNYVDPVTVCSLVAKFPEGSLVWRLRTQANITHLLNEGWQDHAAIIGEVVSQLEGKKVLVYGHRSLKERIEKLFDDHAGFGTDEWAFEHWWGGRGKDHYRDFDAVLLVSEPIQNIDGMLHKVNARAARETARLLAQNKKEEALVEGQKITFSTGKMKASFAHTMRLPGTHWRVRQEHERQNVSELAQASHRVRGLISPKLMVILGQEIELTRDTIAAAVTTVPASQPDSSGSTKGPSKVTDRMMDGCLTAAEAFAYMEQIEEHFGCWSPAFLHAFTAVEVSSVLGAIGTRNYKMAPSSSSGVTGRHSSGRPIIEEATNRSPWTMSDCHSCGAVRPQRDDGDSTQEASVLPQVRPGQIVDAVGHGAGPSDRGTCQVCHSPLQREVVPLALMQRVWFPPTRWKNLYQLAQNNMKRLHQASGMARQEFKFQGKYRPSWEDKAHQGYAWYSRHSAQRGHDSFVEIMECQYGVHTTTGLVTPNKKQFVPF